MFLQNKYTKWYFSIINASKTQQIDGYFEIHHIIPRCMGGSDDDYNLVRLTAKQHFVCHLLLTKMVVQEPYLSKLKYAAILLSTVKGFAITSKMYHAIRSNIKQTPEWVKKRTKNLKGRESPTKGTVAWNRGIPNTPEQKKKISESLKGRKPWNYGKPQHDDVKEKISNTLKTKDFSHMKRKVACQYCGFESTQSVITRYHNHNCKHK